MLKHSIWKINMDLNYGFTGKSNMSYLIEEFLFTI